VVSTVLNVVRSLSLCLNGSSETVGCTSNEDERREVYVIVIVVCGRELCVGRRG
jgi:hypothetical protein